MTNYRFIAFTDADFSVPVEEILNFFVRVHKSLPDVAHAIRPIFSKSIDTTTLRRMLGIAFRLQLKVILNNTLKDTQCGLKAYSTDFLQKIDLKTPFKNPWLFDIEIILRHAQEQFVLEEIILLEWAHKKGSKVSILDSVEIFRSLLYLRKTYGKLSF
jgi:hypothetical protein